MSKAELLRLLVSLSDLSGLDQREKLVLQFRTGVKEGATTLKQIADKFGITGERVRQIQHQAIKKLRPKAGNLT